MSQERGSVLVIVPENNLTPLHQIRVMARERATEMGGRLVGEPTVHELDTDTEVDGETVRVKGTYYTWAMVRRD